MKTTGIFPSQVYCIMSIANMKLYARIARGEKAISKSSGLNDRITQNTW